MGKIVIYTTRKCKFCRKAKDILSYEDIPYTEVLIDEHPELRDIVVKLTGKKTVPQIFFHDEYIGGCDSLEELQESGDLDSKALIALKKKTSLDIMIPENAKECKGKEKEEEVILMGESIDDVSSTFNMNLLDFSSSNDLDSVYYKILPLTPEQRGSEPPMNTGVHRSGLKSYRKSFYGKKLYNWIISNCTGATPDSATKCCQGFIDLGYMVSLTSKQKKFISKELYKWTCDGSNHTLNMKRRWTGKARKASVLAAELNKTLLLLEDQFFSKEGVVYEGIAKSKQFKFYCELATELQTVKLRKLTGNEKLAFWINIYNALVIHANILRGQPKNAIQRRSFFGSMCYVINQLPYTLTDIEHGVLRGNKKPPGSFKKTWSKNNPRQFSKMNYLDPRIHFTLVCGAKSCPPVSVYTPNMLDAQLDWATEAFCSEEVKVNLEKKTITLSPLFMWYRSDFGKTRNTLFEWIKKYISENRDYFSLLDNTYDLTNIKIKYSKYNWDSNGRGYGEIEHNKKAEALRSAKEFGSITDNFSTTTIGMSFEASTENDEDIKEIKEIFEKFEDNTSDTEYESMSK